MVTKRKVREEGHKRKFLAVVDETPECARAITYAARRVRAIDASLVLVYVAEPGDFGHWLTVENAMRAEQHEAGERALAMAAEIARGIGIEPECVIREGKTVAAISGLIDDDEDIALMVLAAGEGKDGPGPLVTAVAGSGSAFHIPVTIVPATLTDEDITDLV